MRQVAFRLPSGLLNRITFPLDQELTPTPNNTAIQNILNLILKLILNELRLQALTRHLRRRTSNKGLKLAHVKDVMQARVPCWKSNSEGYGVDHGLNHKRTNIPRRQLTSQPTRQRKMLGTNPNLVPNANSSVPTLTVRGLSHSLRGFGKSVPHRCKHLLHRPNPV